MSRTALLPDQLRQFVGLIRESADRNPSIARAVSGHGGLFTRCDHADQDEMDMIMVATREKWKRS